MNCVAWTCDHRRPANPAAFFHLETLSDSRGDPSPVVKFSVERSNTILAGQRKRLARLPDQGALFPLPLGKTQQVLQILRHDNSGASCLPNRPRAESVRRTAQKQG
jgi:hypothetical protein